YIGEIDNKKFRLVLLGIYKDYDKKFIFNPSADLDIQEGDYLIVIGNIFFIKEYDRYVHS
ncbi:MAG: potassium transporter TrkA, partial [Campylobacterales bacterium]|nr:potassium transporter TrkA [Campylobacterales bacterium]